MKNTWYNIFMINKELKSKLINYYDKKEDKIFASVIIDKINKFQTSNYLIYTSFLNLFEKEIAISILNKLKINYYIFSLLEDTSKFVIFLLPEYIFEENIEEIVKQYISVIKIIPKTKGRLTHREYMGAIYSLGLKEDMIGDIFVYNDNCYFFCFKQNEQFIFNNLNKVARSYVELKLLDIYSDEVKEIKVNFKNIEVTIPSLRVDVILAEVFFLSRNEIKQKIQKGDLFINSHSMFFVAYMVKEGDIISLKGCGKIKIGKILRYTKSAKIVLNIKKYS